MSAELIKRYASLLEEMGRQAASLAETLETERKDMADVDAAKVKPNLTAKLEKIKILEQNIDERRAILEKLKLPVDAEGHSLLLSKLPKPVAEKLDAIAVKAEKNIERCQQLNQGNAQVLDQLKAKADKIKLVISGGEGQRLYGAKGVKSGPSSKRSLGEA